MQPWNEFTILPLSSYNITNTINPENYGKVVQTGSYGWVTLEAIPNEGYAFVNWTKNGEVVSEESEYSFVVTSDRNFIANFSREDISLNVVATAVNVEEVVVYDVYGRQQLAVNSQPLWSKIRGDFLTS